MAYIIDVQTDAHNELAALRKVDEVKIREAIARHLTYEPTLESKSRIKHLRDGTIPPYRLRVDNFRVFYDVDVEEQLVIVYGVSHKSQALAWLAAFKRKMAGEGIEDEDHYA